MVVGISAITYSAIMHLGAPNPFDRSVSQIEVLGFLANEAFRGAIFGLIDAVGGATESRLSVNFREHWFFASVIAVFRIAVMASVINSVRNIFKSSRGYRKIQLDGDNLIVNLSAVKEKLLTDQNIETVVREFLPNKSIIKAGGTSYKNATVDE